MHRTAVPAQRTQRRNAVVLAGIIALGLVVSALIVAGPKPSGQDAAAEDEGYGGPEEREGQGPI